MKKQTKQTTEQTTTTTTTAPASLDYAAALAVVGNVEALAIIRRNAARGVSWANVRDVISAARFKTATTCDVCAAFGVATVIPAGHASISQRGVAACETCVTSPLWPAVAGARPETVRDVLTAGGFIA